MTKPDPATITDPRERLIYLRDHLANLPDPSRFSMESYFGIRDEYDEIIDRGPAHIDDYSTRTCGEMLEGDCGTTACIAGYALFLFTPNVPWGGMGGISTFAGEVLGLGPSDASDLFTPVSHITCSDPSKAARVLTHLIETGEVDWHVE
jgi:hypothetical protein